MADYGSKHFFMSLCCVGRSLLSPWDPTIYRNRCWQPRQLTYKINGIIAGLLTSSCIRHFVHDRKTSLALSRPATLLLLRQQNAATVMFTPRAVVYFMLQSEEGII